MDRLQHPRKTESENHSKVTVNMDEYKQSSYALHKAIKQARYQYRDKVESQFNGTDTRRMLHGLQAIMYYKGKTEENTMPKTRATAAHEDR
jgi:NADH:ubiquinone oxidoreductase subunit D